MKKRLCITSTESYFRPKKGPDSMHTPQHICIFICNSFSFSSFLFFFSPSVKSSLSLWCTAVHAISFRSEELLCSHTMNHWSLKSYVPKHIQSLSLFSRVLVIVINWAPPPQYGISCSTLNAGSTQKLNNNSQNSPSPHYYINSLLSSSSARHFFFQFA